MVSKMSAAWPEWTSLRPELAAVPDPTQLRRWLPRASASEADPVLYGLAWLASVEAGRDELAAQVLAWALLPAATQLAFRLRTLTEEIDHLVACELWACVRTFPLSRRKVAANLSRDLRTRVLREHAEISGSGFDTVMAWVGESELMDRTLDCEPNAWDEVVDVLDEACERGAITPRDRQLLLSLVAVAHELPGPARGGLGLLGDRATREVARRLGMSERTVKRHARLALDALTHDAPLARISA